MVDIASSLGIGSGIDTTQLVSDLVSAVKQPKQALITSRVDSNNAKISALASARSALTTFTTALTTTLQGSGYAGQPVSNDASIAAVSLIAGGVPSGLPAQLEVRSLASAQTIHSAPLTDATTAAVGQGTLTLTNGKGSFAITIDNSNNNLTGLAAAINAKNTGTNASGVVASVVTDNQGSRLVLKGASGAASGFTLSDSGNADANLQRFVFDGATQTMSSVQSAADAVIKIDGVEMHFSDNVVKTAIPFVRIDLNKAAPGTLVTLGTDEPTSSVADLVSEFVTAYNTLRSALNSSTAPGTESTDAGALSGDAGVRDMMRRLQAITSTQLATTGPYQTLADIGISTNRDGTLKMSPAKLNAALAANPTAVTQMLNPAVSTTATPGLAASMSAITDTITGKSGALVSSENKYKALQASLTGQQDKLDTDMTSYEARLKNTYSKMQAQLASLKATNSYITQQVAAWSNSN